MSQNRRIALCFSAFLLTLAATAVSAQDARGAINGTVTDPSGGIVPGVTIRVTNADTGVSVEATTNAHGAYDVPFLLPGSYSVSAELEGFKKATRFGIRVDVGAHAGADFALELGSTLEAVTVSGAPPLLEATSADLGQVVPKAYITDVGTSIFRNAANFVRLAPGVTGQSQGTYTSDNQTAVSINGGGGVQGGNEWILDGVPDTVPLSTGSVVVVPPVDAIEEMKVHTTMFDAAYGHSTGGAVTIVTKSGTNALRGDAFAFRRPTALAANSWANNRNHLAKPDVNYWLGGGAAGGPLAVPGLYDGRGRTFWFAAYEGDRDVRDLFQSTRVPTAAEAAGDFSATLSLQGAPLVLYNPYSTVLSSTGTFVSRSPFMCNGNAPVTPNANGTQTGGTPCAIIPRALINPIGAAVLATLVQESGGPNIAGTRNQFGVDNWTADKTYTVSQRNLNLRVDHVLSPKQSVFARVSRVTRNQVPEVLIAGAQQYNGSGANIDTFLQYRTAGMVTDTYAFSSAFLGSFAYGFSRRENVDTFGSYGESAPAAWQLPAVLTTNQFIAGMPNFALAGADTGVSLGARANLLANNSHSLMSTFTRAQGRHTVKFGSDLRLEQYETSSQGVAAAGQFNFSALFTDGNPLVASSAQTSGSSAASLLLGLADSGSLARTAPLSLRHTYLGLFVQDTWRRDRVTLTFGLRYEVETPYTERDDQVAFGFNPAATLPLSVPGRTLAGGLEFAGVDGRPRREGRIDPNNFGPRFGATYRLTSQTILRGGYGLFFAPMVDLISNLGGVATFSSSTPYIGTSNGSATPATNLTNPFPNGIVQPLGSTPGLLAQVGNSLSFVNPDRVAPYTHQWQVSVQRELPASTIVELAYVGMLSRKELESYNLNDVPAEANVAAGTTQVSNPFFGIFPATSTLGASRTIAARSLQVAFPQFTTLTEDGLNVGESNYHAVSARVEKRLSHGLSAIGSYSFSHLVHNHVTSLVNAAYLHSDTVNYRSIASLDQPHLFRLALTYTLPSLFEGRGPGSRVLRAAIGGWAVTNYLTLESGLPLNITGTNGRPIITGDPSNPGPVNARLGDVVVNGAPQNPYFNTSVFQQLPSQFYPGSISPTPPFSDSLRAPGLQALNTSVSKTIGTGRVRTELRLEAYNVTNRPFFNAPGTNSASLGTFGVITGASNSRQVQAGVKVKF
jgi:hypothetical protein